MIINNIELEDIDMLDADVAEKYENALYIMQDRSNESKEELSLAEVIRKECNLVFDFFNEVFGQGTDKKVFGTRTNYRECLEAFEQVVKYAGEQKKDIDKVMGKYSSNRANRR